MSLYLKRVNFWISILIGRCKKFDNFLTTFLTTFCMEKIEKIDNIDKNNKKIKTAKSIEIAVFYW